MTRLGASPYSMWRDVAHTNTEQLLRRCWPWSSGSRTLRENLKTPELRDEFERANRFRTNPPSESTLEPVAPC
jgi:prephenate dehydrogenase